MHKPLSAVALLLLALGCQKAPAQSATPPQATPQAQSPAGSPAAPEQPGAAAASAVKPVPAQLPAVLARVNGEAIDKTEFERALKSVEARAGQPVPAEKRDEVYRGVLDQIVTLHLLLQEAKARKVAVADTEIETQVAGIKKQFPNEDEFEKALSARGTTVETLRDDIRREIVIGKMMEAEIGPKISVKDADIKDFYDKNPAQFQQAEMFRASHILLRVDQGATEAQKKEVRAKMEGLLKEIRGGADFAALAKQHSQDASAQNGGDLNFFQKGQMVPPFEQAVMALKPGEVSGVVETQFGLHLIKLTEKQAPRTVPLPEVSQRIGQFLVMQAQQRKSGEFIETLKAKGRVEILM